MRDSLKDNVKVSRERSESAEPIGCGFGRMTDDLETFQKLLDSTDARTFYYPTG